MNAVFSAFLRQHPLLSLLREDCRMLWPPAAAVHEAVFRFSRGTE